jgi:hypothetical protein
MWGEPMLVGDSAAAHRRSAGFQWPPETQVPYADDSACGVARIPLVAVWTALLPRENDDVSMTRLGYRRDSKRQGFGIHRPGRRGRGAIHFDRGLQKRREGAGEKASRVGECEARKSIELRVEVRGKSGRECCAWPLCVHDLQYNRDKLLRRNIAPTDLKRRRRCWLGSSATG